MNPHQRLAWADDDIILHQVIQVLTESPFGTRNQDLRIIDNRLQTLPHSVPSSSSSSAAPDPILPIARIGWSQTLSFTFPDMEDASEHDSENPNMEEID